MSYPTLAFLVLVGCGKQIVRSCAEAEEAPVADDVMLDLGFSVSDLVQEASPGAIDLYDLDGRLRSVQLSVTRGEGDALLVDKTIEDDVTPGIGSSTSITFDFNDGCTDELTVPIVATLTSTDGEIDVRATGTLYTFDDGTMNTGVTLSASFDPALTTYPPGFHADPVSGLIRATLLREPDPTLAVWVTSSDGAQEAVLSTPGIF